MVDFLLGLYLAGLLVRGWLRGFVRELLDLVGLVLGIALAFRLSGPLGDFLADQFDVTPEWARIGAGIALFLLVGVGLSLAAHLLGRVVRLPGLALGNRVLGAAFATAWGVVLVLLVVSVARVLPMPPAVDEALDRSRVVSVIAAAGAPPQELFQEVAGDEVMETILALEPLLGRNRVILEGDERIELEPAEPSEIEDRPGEAEEVFRLLNDARVEEGVDPVAWSEGLAEVALGHAREMYLEGYLSHVSPTTGTVLDRVEAAGIRLFLVGENLALAASPRAVHRGLMDSPGHRENILRPGFDRVGVGAVRGPLGLMVVEVFGG